MPGITLLYTSKVMPHVGVSEALLHDLGVRALTEQHRRVGVAWVAGDALVESGSSANARQTNAAVRRARRCYSLTLQYDVVRSGAHSVALTGDYKRTG